MGQWGERGGWKGVTWKLFCSAQAGTWGLAWEAKSSPLPWSPVLLCPSMLALLIHSSQQPRVNPLLWSPALLCLLLLALFTVLVGG